MWLDDDQDKALEWQADQARICQECGTRREDWLDEDGKLLYPPPLVAQPTQCPGCEVTETEQENVRELEPEQRRGVKVHLGPNPEAEVTPS